MYPNNAQSNGRDRTIVIYRSPVHGIGVEVRHNRDKYYEVFFEKDLAGLEERIKQVMSSNNLTYEFIFGEDISFKLRKDLLSV